MEEVVFNYEHIGGARDTQEDDGFVFKAADEPAEGATLLLPAVQAAPEGPRPTGDETPDDSFEFTSSTAPAATSGDDEIFTKPVLDFELTGTPASAALDGDHKDWIPILDIHQAQHKPAADAEDPYLYDYVAPLEIDDGKSHHDAWQDGG